MNARLLLACGVAALSGAVLWSQTPVAGQAPAATPPAAPAAISRVQSQPARAAADADVASRRALVDQYCVTCHNARLKTANLLLDQLDLTHLGDHAEVAEKVVRSCAPGLMPPTGMTRPDQATLDGFAQLDGRRARRSATVHLPAPGTSPPQSHRVRQRDSRSAGARSRRHEVPAARRLDARVRQHRRRADDVAGADGGVPVGGGQDQPARDRHVAPRRRRRVFDVPADTRAEPPRRGAAVRHPRRHADRARVPGRRRVQRSP